MKLDPIPAIDELQHCVSIERLADAFASVVAQLGMTASVSGMLTGPRAIANRPIHFRNWDPKWLELYDSQGFLAYDPLIRWPMVSGAAGSWTEIYAKFPARDPGHGILAAARKFNYHEGFVTPVRTLDGSTGLVSVGGGRRAPFDRRERLYLEAVSTCVLRQAEDLLGAEQPEIPASKLTQRERECVALLRQGMTDAEIAKTMGIAPGTVRDYIDQARAKLGARNRTQLAVMAVP
jgi:DNA-binding CsgD family transcriptional regulator